MVAVAEVQDCHTDEDAVGDLFKNDGLFRVGEFRVNFDAAVDGAGVHDEGTGFEPFGAGFVETKDAGVFADGGEMGRGLALVLNAEEHDRVGVFEGGLQVVANADPHGAKAFGDEGAGSGDGDFGAEFLEANDIGARHAAKEDVAEDGDLLPVEGAEFIDKGEGVEQGLGGVGVGTVARIDDGNVDHFAQVVGGAGGRVAHDDDVGLKGLEVAGGIAEAFAFGKATGRSGDRDGVGREVLSGGFEGEAGAGAGLEKEVHHGASLEVGLFFMLLLECFLKRSGGLKNSLYLRPAERF